MVVAVRLEVCREDLEVSEMEVFRRHAAKLSLTIVLSVLDKEHVSVSSSRHVRAGVGRWARRRYQHCSLYYPARVHRYAHSVSGEEQERRVGQLAVWSDAQALVMSEVAES